MQVLPVRPRLANGKFPLLLTLAKVLDLGVDEVAQALEVEAALRARTHEQVAPDPRGRDRIVDGELHGPV